MRISQNKKALFDYHVLEEVEAGIVLTGEEIKAIRANKVNISGSYVKPMVSDKLIELWWIGAVFNLPSGISQRNRKLLLHKIQMDRLIGRLSASNLTIVPLELYLTRGLAKIRIALASRKKNQDKRELLKKRAIEKETRSLLKKKTRSSE